MRAWMTVCLIAGMTAAAAAAPKPPHSIKKFAVVALARDAARAAEVEAGVKEALAQEGIQADGLRTLFSTTTANVSEILERLRQEGYEGVLCMAPRKTIQITRADKTSKISDLELCLTTFVTGKSPSGDQLDVNPVAPDTLIQGSGNPTTARTPIPTNSAAVPYTVNKGALRFFNLSGRLRWQGNVNVKLPSDIQTTFETKLLVREIVAQLDKSGLYAKP